MYYGDDSARPEEDDEDDDLSLPTVDGLTDTAVTTSGLPTRLTELLVQRPGGSVGDTARAVTALEDAIRRESSDTLRSRLVAARALILDLPLAD